jgi:site-specific DNA-methyltransferase (adenine-specific)
MIQLEIDNSDFRKSSIWKELDLVVTSPPYKDEDNYTDDLMEDMGAWAWDHLKDDTLFFINFGHLANFKSRPFRVAMMMEDMGFNWIDTITWTKNHFRPLQGNKRVNNLTEFIFMMGKGKPEIDRLAIGVPYADKSNATRWKAAGGVDKRCRGNVWDIKYETVVNKAQKLHNDRFPLDLPKFCIKLAGLEAGDVVGDPFSGSGTTAVACKEEGVDFLGTEIDKEHFDTAIKRLKY